MGFAPIITSASSGEYLRFRVRELAKMSEMIEPYVIPTMRYKLILGRRLPCFICGESFIPYRKSLSNPVCSVSCRKVRKKMYDLSRSSKRTREYVYDIKTSTGNFFANGILSHNCEEPDISNYKLSKSIHPMGASTNATMIKIGTPNAQKNEFFDACDRNRKKTATLGTGELPSHFQYDYEYPARYNPRYGAYIEKEIERLGYDSDEFRMSYRLHWMLERGHFIAPEIFDACGIRKTDKLRVKKKGKFIHFKRNESHYYNDNTTENMVASIDIGRSNDSTVVTVGKAWWDNPIMFAGEDRYHLHVVNWLEIQGDDHETQYPQILDFLSNYKIGSIIVDATGRGDPIFDRLRADLYEEDINVHPFIFSQGLSMKGTQLCTRR